MTNEQILILNAIKESFEKDPSQRFGQVLFNLNINQFADRVKPGRENYHLRDIYNDSDKEILERVIDTLEAEELPNLDTSEE